MIINFLALIPARMGSKRIKRKNLIKLHNKKLIQYTLESSIQSKKINKILLSTDDPMVIKLGKKFKVDFIIKRPQKFSKENTSMEVVIDHTLEFLKNHGIKVKSYIHLMPGHNFRMSNMLAAFGLAQLNKLDFIFKERLKLFRWYLKYLNNDKIIFQKILKRNALKLKI